MDHGDSDVLRRYNYAYSGSAFDREYFLAVDLEAGTGFYRLSRHGSHGHFYRRRHSGGVRCGATLDSCDERRARAAGGFRPPAYECWRSEDGLLLGAKGAK